MDPGTSSRHQQLTSGNDTRSARCLERGTPGAGGGPRETTGGNTGTRPRAYLTTAILIGDQLMTGTARRSEPLSSTMHRSGSPLSGPGRWLGLKSRENSAGSADQLVRTA